MLKLGNSLGTSFPREVLKKLGFAEEQTFFIVETAEGIFLTPYDLTKKISDRYKNALR